MVQDARRRPMRIGCFGSDLASELALDETILPHGLQLWVDTDNNPNTGWIQSQMGVELVMDFASNEVRRYNAGGVSNDAQLQQHRSARGPDVQRDRV